MKPKSAVLFDLDGTLVDTIRDIGSAMNVVLERHRYPTHGFESYKAMVGWGMRKLVARAVPPEAQGDDAVSTLLAEMMEQYGRYPVVDSTPYPGIRDLLDGLASRGIPAAILSNKPDGLCRSIIDILFPCYPFVVVQGEIEGFPRKPDPTAALSICARMKLEPQRVLYMGDSGVDVETAHKAGMFCAGAVWGFRGAEELILSGADILLASPIEALSLLGPPS